MIMEPINSEDDCIRELIRCRERFAEARVQSASDVNHQLSLYGFGSGSPHDLGNASPVPEIARQFAREAAKALSKDEFSSLLVFLQDPKGHRKAPKEHLKQQLDARLKSFYDEEIQVSGLKKDRLARPGGPEDADLGIILHLQSEEDTIGPFWNEESATIDLLMRKGLGEKAVFGFDWHWRAEETFRGRSACPALREAGLRPSGLFTTTCHVKSWRSCRCHSWSLHLVAREITSQPYLGPSPSVYISQSNRPTECCVLTSTFGPAT